MFAVFLLGAWLSTVTLTWIPIDFITLRAKRRTFVTRVIFIFAVLISIGQVG